MDNYTNILLIIFVLAACSNNSPHKKTANTELHEQTTEIAAQQFPTCIAEIPLSQGYQRESLDTLSFAYYLRSFPLKPEGTPVRCYDGSISYQNRFAYAVLDIDTGDRDLQQCADAIIRLKAEWLYKQGRYEDIAFHFTNGWLCDYRHWAEGNRVRVSGNQTNWYKAAEHDYSYRTFRQYLNMVFNYAGTLSLARELTAVSIDSLQIGDVFIQGGSPGHAI